MGIWKDKVRKDWCYEFLYQKKRYAGRGFTARREAITAREERRKELKKGTAKVGMAYSDAVNLYLDHAERRFAVDTYKYKKYVYQQFYLFLNRQDPPIHSITPAICKSYLQTRHSNNNFNVHRRDLSALFTYSKEILEVVLSNPIKKIDKMPHSVKKKVIPQENDVIKLILAADPKTDERDLLVFLLHTLARIDEALRMTWDDVNFEKRVVTKLTRKTKDGSYKEVPVKINDELYDVLWKMWENKTQGTWVFYNKRTKNRFIYRPKFMKGVCKRAGIVPHFGFHTLRHLMSSLMADNPKISTKTIQKILGHSEMKTTEIYLHELDGAVETAMDSISGKFTQKETFPQPSSTTKNQKGS